MDRGQLIYIHVQNNGVGPFILERLTFFKNREVYFRIEDCLNIDPKSYQQNTISKTVKKVILPGGFHEVFSTHLEKPKTDEELTQIRKQLSVLHLKVEGKDIYNNKVMAERELHWFTRHSLSNDNSIV